MLKAAPYRADHVGSLLRPERLKEARRQAAAGTLSPESLTALENEEIRRIVARQQEIGLKAVTDGELRRAYWHFDFLEHLKGVQAVEVTDNGIHFQGQSTQSHSIRVVDRVGFDPNHPMLQHFRYLAGVAGASVPKMTIPSPSMLHFRGQIDPQVYPDLDLFFHDLAQAYQDALRAFYDAGCRYLQLDDTSWAYLCSAEQRSELQARGLDPDELQQRYAQTLNQALAHRPADLTITMHICRGNFRSSWIASGGYEPVAETLFGTVNVDGFFLEYDTERAGGFEPLRFATRPDLKIVLGLITSKFPALEDSDMIKRRIDEASRYVDGNRLCLSPQCGFASTEEGNLLTEEEQWAKLQHVVAIARDVWGSI
ncbi:MAG: 5-methyltetrahydropteroyltriglutamate--homocysteine S-methyltransferase [Firmicutes bacterium]|nr:5-methyltetrahydropteroyltriglutamate--homocysteine S-methyltransferase [Bacillota bacterium]